MDLTDEEGQKMSLMTSPFSITGDKYALNVGSPGIEPGMESNLLIIPNAERLTFTKYVSRNKNLESTKKEHLFCTSFIVLFFCKEFFFSLPTFYLRYREMIFQVISNRALIFCLDSGKCEQPLGMEDKTIPDSSITASGV